MGADLGFCQEDGVVEGPSGIVVVVVGGEEGGFGDGLGLSTFDPVGVKGGEVFDAGDRIHCRVVWDLGQGGEHLFIGIQFFVVKGFGLVFGGHDFLRRRV